MYVAVKFTRYFRVRYLSECDTFMVRYFTTELSVRGRFPLPWLISQKYVNMRLKDEEKGND